MPFYINEKLYLEGITLSQEEFYERLKNDEAISTSQPGPADVCGLWNTLLEKYDEVVHIPMSSGLSASCDTAISDAIALTVRSNAPMFVEDDIMNRLGTVSAHAEEVDDEQEFEKFDEFVHTLSPDDF